MNYKLNIYLILFQYRHKDLTSMYYLNILIRSSVLDININNTITLIKLY